MRLAVALPPLALAATAPVWADDPPAGSVLPDEGPFYSAPADIGTYRPGQVVATRKTTPEGGNLADTVDARRSPTGPMM